MPKATDQFADRLGSNGRTRLEQGDRADRYALAGILDREIPSEELDAFGHRHFADALGSMIESSEYQPPYSIGLLGRWGTGKSSVKSLYLASLRRDQRKTNGRTRGERFHPISFNAWRYGGEDIRRALLRHVFLELGGHEERLKDVISRTIQRERLDPRAWHDMLREGLNKTLFYGPQLVLFLGLAGLFYWWISSHLPVTEDWPRVTLAAVPALVFVILVQQLSGNLSWLISRYRPVVAIEEPQTSAEEYEGLLFKQLTQFKRNNRNCERIVVFVDDLDRLSAEEMVTGLDAIRTFMELPTARLQGLGIVFVISCDEERVATALSDRQRQKENPEAPGAVFTISDARKFLDRIFQFRLEIPPFPPQDLRLYAKKRLTEDIRDVAGDLQRRDVPLDDVIDRLIPPNVHDPRTAVQSLNAFAQSWWIARQREFAGTGSDQPGGLQQGAVTNHPIALAALCALKINFPDFYADLLAEPRLVQYFTDVFLRGADDELPESAQALLRRYANAEDTKNRSSGIQSVNEGYRPLRQYIASLQALHWPTSLQPLLLLSQDPVSRRYGDRAPAVFNAMGSGDHEAVLEALGRHLDSDLLGNDEARLLKGMQDDLESDTPVRRDNAAAAIAALAPRLAAPEARQLLTPVARRLTTSAELRSRLGVDGIAQILPAVALSDRATVAGRLVEDLLLPEGEEPAFRTTTNQPLTFDEAVTVVSSAVLHVLSVWEETDLRPHQERRLLAWMSHRTVEVDGRSTTMPFEQLDAWVASHETRLLPALGADYVKMLADELAADRNAQMDLTAALGRARVVLKRLAQDDRQQFWELLSRLISLQSPDAVSLVWSLAEQQRKTVSEQEFSTFMRAFAHRLNQEDNDDGWELNDWTVDAGVFLELATSRHELIAEETWSECEPLATSWSDQDASSDYAIRLLELLYRHSPPVATTVIDNWIARAISNDQKLVTGCRAWLGSHFSDRLHPEQRERLQAELGALVNQPTVTADESEALLAIVSNLSTDARLGDEMQTLLQTMLERTSASHANSKYLEMVVPPMAILIEVTPVATTAPRLLSLFAQTQSVPATFTGLHSLMLGHWPDASEDGSQVNFASLFSQSLTVLQKYPTTEGAGNILRSLQQMISRGLLPEENAEQLVAIACEVWHSHQEAASAVLQSANVPPPATKVASLATDVDAASDEAIGYLRATWTHIADLLEPDERLAVAAELLTQPPINGSSIPDLGLTLWVDVQGERTAYLLQRTMTNDDFNGSQQVRVWHQIDRIVDDLDTEFFEQVLPDVLTRGSEEVAGAAMTSRQKITERFDGPSARHDLSRLLLDAFVRSTDLETKRQLVSWLQDLGNASILKDLRGRGDVDLSDVELLLEGFPSNRSLKTLHRALTAAD